MLVGGGIFAQSESSSKNDENCLPHWDPFQILIYKES